MTSNAKDALEEIFNSTNEDLPVQARKYACTVVSLLPRVIFEEKPHMLPSTFRVPAAVYGDIAILHVEEGIHWVPDPFSERSLKQTTSPAEMARSIVEDYASAHICLDEGCKPGLFWVEGRLTVQEVKKFHKSKIAKHKEMQDNWFHALCNMADTDWNKNHNMLAVSDLQRMAARSLGIDKEWVQLRGEVTIACKFCGFRVSPDAIKCVNCKEVLDKLAYDKLTREPTLEVRE